MKAFEKPKVGDDIEVQWDDEEYYLCTVFKAQRRSRSNHLVVECHDDKGVYAINLADGGWRWHRGWSVRTLAEKRKRAGFTVKDTVCDIFWEPWRRPAPSKTR